MKTLFPAIVDRAADGTYGVFFPDVEGCSSAGDTLEEAVKNAEDALAQHLEVLSDMRLEMPAPSELKSVAKPGDAVALMLIQARVPSKAHRINITMEEALLDRIDAVSKNRSAFLADAARNELDRREGVMVRKARPGVKMKIGKRKIRIGRRGRIASKNIVG